MGFLFRASFLVFNCFLWSSMDFHDTGPPITDGLCEDMDPDHRHDPVGEIEFHFSGDPCYDVGRSVNVTIIQAGNEQVGYIFRGIMIQAKVPGVTTTNYGQFNLVDSKQFKASDCFGKPKSAFHQKMRLSLSNLTFNWISEAENVGDLEFYITLVFTASLSKNDLKIPMPLCSNLNKSTSGSSVTENVGTSTMTVAPTTLDPAVTLGPIASLMTTQATEAIATATTTATTSTIALVKHEKESTTKPEKYSMSSLNLQNSATKVKHPWTTGSLSPILIFLIISASC